MSLLSRLRRSQQIILALFAVVFTSGFLVQTTGHRVLGGFLFALSILGVLGLLAFLLVRPLARKLLWRVRDRLFLTYFLAGAVPLVLLLLLGCLGFGLVLNQTANYMLHAELSRHLEQLQTSAERLALDVASGRGPTESIARGEGAVIRNGNRVSSIPETSLITEFPAWSPPRFKGIIRNKAGMHFFAAHATQWMVARNALLRRNVTEHPLLLVVVAAHPLASLYPSLRRVLFIRLCTRIRRGPHFKPLSEER